MNALGIYVDGTVLYRVSTKVLGKQAIQSRDRTPVFNQAVLRSPEVVQCLRDVFSLV